LTLVDEKKIAMRPAVEISYLPKELQEILADCIEMEQCTPSHAQTIRMRKLLDKGELTSDAIETIMLEEKPNQKERIVLRGERFKELFPPELPPAKREDYVVAAMEYYSRHRAKQKNRDDAR
jgi:ParB family chromosome partitioning protein